MTDPTIVAAIIAAAGGLLQQVLKLAGKSSPGAQTKNVMEKTYEKVAGEVTTNSLRVLLVLKEVGSSQTPGEIAHDVVPLAKQQEPHGDNYENDLTYRLKFLSILGLLQPVGGSEFALTQLGAAFIEKASSDTSRYRSAFKVLRRK